VRNEAQSLDKFSSGPSISCSEFGFDCLSEPGSSHDMTEIFWFRRSGTVMLNAFILLIRSCSSFALRLFTRVQL
jgi:hypothetical protein